MNTRELKSQIEGINIWEKGAQRAPHKPLLLLYALARSRRNRDRFIPYTDVDAKLRQFLIDFGPTRRSYHPEYPFWRLQNDGIWELQNAENISLRTGSTDAKKSRLIKYNVHGGFKRKIFDIVTSDQAVAGEIATEILEANFPSSIHDDILQAVGLDLEPKTTEKRKRGPHFRDRIIQAYEFQCAVCGFNVRVGHAFVALEAAHIKWHQAGGPDSEENGIALCASSEQLPLSRKRLPDSYCITRYSAVIVSWLLEIVREFRVVFDDLTVNERFHPPCRISFLALFKTRSTP